MTSTFSPRRGRVMTYRHTITQVQRSVGSKDKVETIGQTHGRLDAIDCVIFPANTVDKCCSYQERRDACNSTTNAETTAVVYFWLPPVIRSLSPCINLREREREREREIWWWWWCGESVVRTTIDRLTSDISSLPVPTLSVSYHRFAAIVLC